MHHTELTDHLATETARLLTTAGRLTDEEVRAPSLCAGWTRGHVLTHVARNADGIARLCRSILQDSHETMYASDEARDREIEDGAARPASEQLADLVDTSTRLAPLVAAIGDDVVGKFAERTPGGRRFEAEKIPFMRLREIVFHHVDLDAGHGFDSLPTDLQLLLLDDMVARLAGSRAPLDVRVTTHEGDTWTIGAGTTEVSGSRAGVLLWLGRDRADHLDDPAAVRPALPFGG